MSDKDDQDDPRRPTHDGSRGPAFRTYKRDFLTFARGKFSKDDRHSWYTAFTRRDEGGTHANAPAMPAQAGGAGGGVNPALTAATTKRQIRQGQAFQFLYESQTDENMRQMLSDLQLWALSGTQRFLALLATKHLLRNGKTARNGSKSLRNGRFLAPPAQNGKQIS